MENRNDGYVYDMTIHKTGYWETTDSSGHVHDVFLCRAIIEHLKLEKYKTVVDFGCGLGDYSKAIINSGFLCEAYDGNPNTELLTNGIGKVLDLANDFNLEKTFDCVISLEVGEHIPQQYEQTFLNNLCKHSSKEIILSWAVKGQGGAGHVNCQDNYYIIREMEKRHFKFNSTVSTVLRYYIDNATWFKNTIMVFNKFNVKW